jgi:SpoVK/Ycf46/Vps4 family AAA+-type ATPase
MPWQPCALSLDEIDTLVANRAGGHTQSYEKAALNTLLSLLDGNDAVDNLFIFGATNLGSSVDKAFRRRMLNNNFYVGVLNAESRRELIKREICEPLTLERNVLEYLVKVTMNLGGSHLKSITRYITSAAHMNQAYAINTDACKLQTRR